MFKITNEISRLKNYYDFEQVDFVFDSIIEGTTIAEVYVNHLESPSISLVWDRGYNFYVGGTAVTTDEHLMATEFLCQKFQNEKIQGAKVYYNSNEWESALINSLRNFAPNIYERSLLKHDFVSNPSARIEPNILIRAIDKNIIESTQLANVDSMKNEILGCWGTTDRFYEKGFGFCAMTDEIIICWCTAEYKSKGSCGIGTL